MSFFVKENLDNLHKTAASTRVQAAEQEKEYMRNQLAQYQDEELLRQLEQEQYEAEKQGKIIGDGGSDGIIVNYANQPNNGFSFQPTWNTNGTMNPTMGNTCMGNGPMQFGGYGQMPYNPFQQDERVIVYNQHPGMRLYNLNPYAFYDADYLLDYYNYLESERQKHQDLNYVLMRAGARCCDNNEEMEKWVEEQFKFIPGDELVTRQNEIRAKAEKEWKKKMYGFDPDEFKDENAPKSSIIYDVYDANGYRFEKSFSFKIYDIETGEVVKEVNRRKDELGQSYEIHTIAEDREQQATIQRFNMEMNASYAFKQTFARLFNAERNRWGNMWDTWKSNGYSWGDIYREWENERVDWERQEALINRALQISSFSRKQFHEIIHDFCPLDWEHRPRFFSLSYDYARDMRYKELTSSEEELKNDPSVKQRMTEEFNLKRKLFMEAVENGRLGCDMMECANKIPSVPKPCIADLTLEDFNKPENKVRYSNTLHPELDLGDAFIPKTNSGDIAAMRALGINVDDNGNILPLRREYTHEVLDDNGNVISSETKVFEGEELQNMCRQANDAMSNSELSELF